MSVMSTARLFKSTGFNAVNLPDSQKMLEDIAADVGYKDYPAMDIISIKRLTSIKIKISNTNYPDAELENVDYCALYQGAKKAYYVVNGYEFLSNDVAKLFLVYDAWTTCGGVYMFSGAPTDILDGVTIRHHVAKNDDVFGKYVENDEMLVPSEPLQIEYGGGHSALYDGNKGVYFASPDNYSSPNGMQLVRSNLDLHNMGSDSDIQWNVHEFVVGDDTSTFGYPKVKVIDSGDYNVIPNGYLEDGYNDSRFEKINCKNALQKIYIANAAATANGIAQARSMGVENCITASWSVPLLFFGDSPDPGPPTPDKLRGTMLKIYLGDIYNGFKYLYKSNQRNLRALYGIHNKYVIKSIASNLESEALPEELIRNPGDFRTMYENSTEIDGPIAVCLTDVRPEGMPYFNFIRMSGGKYWGSSSQSSSQSYRKVNMYDKAVPGQQWAQTPIQYTTLSGTAQAVLSENMKIAYDDSNASYAGRVINGGGIFNSMGANAVSMGSAVANASGFGAKANPYTDSYGNVTYGDTSGGGGIISTALGWAEKGLTKAAYYGAGALDWLLGTDLQSSDAFAGLNKEAAADNIRQRQRAYEMAQFQVTNLLPHPDMAFPQTYSLRDAVSNGAAIYRYRPSDNDLEKFDKILDMYGYRVTEPVKPEHFTNRAKFNYVQISGFTISATSGGKTAGTGSQMNMMDRNDIASMFATGIRIWHVKPNPVYYTNGENI